LFDLQDPAGPLFSVNLPKERFDANDAVYTESIHTSGGILGFETPLGQAVSDFC